MKLSPEVNLLAVAHYLQALEVQRKANKIVTILGSKTPHIQNVAVGGVSNPIATDSQSVLTVERLLAIKGWIDELADFVKNVYLVDVAAVGAFYADWTTIGAGVTNYLSVPDIPLDTKGTQFALPGGYIEGGDLASFKPITSFDDDYFSKGVEESVKHSWYNGGKGALHPYKGETMPELHRLPGRRQVFLAEVADLLRQACPGRPAGPGAGMAARPVTSRPLKYATAALDTVSAPGQDQGRRWTPCIRPSAVMPRAPCPARCNGRPAVRAVDSCCSTNIGKGDLKTFNKPVFPKGEVMRRRLPRGAARRAVALGGDRRRQDQELPVRRALDLERLPAQREGRARAVRGLAARAHPIADPERPLEVLRTVHSFDPCLACAVHVLDTDQNEVVKVRAS